jgi:hypothetical protein
MVKNGSGSQPKRELALYLGRGTRAVHEVGRSKDSRRTLARAIRE